MIYTAIALALLTLALALLYEIRDSKNPKPPKNR
jgi:hypothetical protein